MALAGASAVGAIERPKSIIAEPYERSPGAITRPAGRADRDWRRGRRTPEVRMTPQPRAAAPLEAPRYDGRGRRLNVPGRPDTYDQIGRANQGLRRTPPVYSSPTVRTDAGSRINQLAPR
ncbi:hypothetical protein [Methylopila turkensis]|uniref:Uncharacterized protein n=1 Tax=Methylopila turkensis TaxID=1437816 RepID=A0A9W6JSB2_9HYPH|nr:hypothetical protein [Methylopila turkensis]GLK80899.1 hypothetical protein GCM10008174_26400 [Methylopila turkensis]